MIQIVIADDQKLLMESLKNMIETNSDIKVAGCAINGEDAYKLCEALQPDVILMDISMPIYNGIQSTKIIKKSFPKIKVLILTASEDEEDAIAAIANGADGYILKNISAEALILSIRAAYLDLCIIPRLLLNHISASSTNSLKPPLDRFVNVSEINVPLTERELNIIEMIVAGNDNKEIAKALFIAEGTVKNAITEIISKLQLKNKTQLAVYAVKHNLHRK